MKGTTEALADEYTQALRDYLEGGGEAALQQAYELGRRVMSEGLGVLELAGMYHEALTSIVRRSPLGSGEGAPLTPEQAVRISKWAGAFFAESLSPFEITHRGFREANQALHRVNELLEEQAKHIAHALHDETGQLLATVYIALEVATRELPQENRESMVQVKEALEQVEGAVRRLSHELRPTILDDLGLAPALEFLAEGVGKRTGMAIRVSGTTAVKAGPGSVSTSGRLAPGTETALYRCVQEALNNAAKHSKAKQVSVRLERAEDSIRCLVRDDGAGFDPEALSRKRRPGLGLLGIRERVNNLGGTLTIHSKPGEGTELVIVVPVPTG